MNVSSSLGQGSDRKARMVHLLRLGVTGLVLRRWATASPVDGDPERLELEHGAVGTLSLFSTSHWHTTRTRSLPFLYLTFESCSWASASTKATRVFCAGLAACLDGCVPTFVC